MIRRFRWFLLVLLVASTFFPVAAQPPKSYHLKPVDLKQQIIWGASCNGPDGTGLAFGGQDQKSDDGIGHTRIKVNGEWKDISEELRKKNPLQEHYELFRAVGRWHREGVLAMARRDYLEGLALQEHLRRLKPEKDKAAERLLAACGKPGELEEKFKNMFYEAQQIKAVNLVAKRLSLLDDAQLMEPKNWEDALIALRKWSVYWAETPEFLAPEPPPRALSPIVYDEKTRLYVLFGGDHLDYLMNDVWVFDMAKKKWEQRHPKTAPPPRANHSLKATGDGKIALSGGYTYTSNTDYVGGQYRDHNDGDWTYDIEKNTWTGTGKAVEPNQRVYRTGPFHPDFYLQGPNPDAKETQEKLKSVPTNTWVSMKPPQLPRLNRDWGTAVLDPDRDLILRFSGGHSAHGGTDVLHYHLATNRWELPFPVEFPLGQLYSNTSYPEGFNFNRRPWVTGHTYKNYGYDTVSKKMYFTGELNYTYIYDPEIGDWAGRFPKPKGMVYGGCFYTLTCGTTPQGLVCWTQQGQIYRLDPAKKEWQLLPLTGATLPGSNVDNATVIYDSKRERLLLTRRQYADQDNFDGEMYEVDVKTNKVQALGPAGRDGVKPVRFLREAAYDAANDLVLFGFVFQGDDRRTLGYDCAGNRWVSLKLTGDDPNGKTGRNVSLGLMYDAKRKLFWAVDTNSNVFVLRLDPKTADVQPLK
jgi:hypothetical protein